MKNKFYSRLLLFFLTIMLMGNSVLTCRAASEKKAPAPAPPPSLEWEIQSDSWKEWPAGPKINAETAVLMDAETGNVLYAKGMDEKRYPASTTKLMTALVAAEHTNPTDSVTFSAEAVNGIERDSTHIGIKPGEILTMEQSLYAILLASANEVSSGVAEFTGGSISGFVDMMNGKALELGCQNTHFVNAHGLHDPEHYTTARDLGLIACAAFKNPYLQKIMATDYFILPVTNITNEERWLNNHHKMLTSGANHYEGCLGGKTGFTTDAGNTLVTFARRNDMTLVSVVLADNAASQYPDSAALLDYGFSQFHKIILSTKGAFRFPADLPLERYFYPSIFPHHMEQSLVTTSAILPSGLGVEDLRTQTFLGKGKRTVKYYINDQQVCTGQISFKSLIPYCDFIKPASYALKQTAVEPQPERTPTTSSDSLTVFFDEISYTFHSLPNWKYPTLLLLLTALFFYIIVLIVRIRRFRRKRRRRKAKKTGTKK